MQIFEAKPRGRPRMIDPHAVSVQLRFSKEELERIDTYAAIASKTTGKVVSRSAAIRALTLQRLDALSM